MSLPKTVTFRAYKGGHRGHVYVIKIDDNTYRVTAHQKGHDVWLLHKEVFSSLVAARDYAKYVKRVNYNLTCNFIVVTDEVRASIKAQMVKKGMVEGEAVAFMIG